MVDDEQGGNSGRHLRFLRRYELSGVPVMVYAVSAGPLTQRSARVRVRDALDPAAVVTVRDRQGQ